MMRRTVLATLAALAVGSLPIAAAAAKGSGGSFTLVQNATLVHPGDHSSTAAELITTGSPSTWGAVDLAIPANLTLAQLNNLATDYTFVTGSCWGGSPRFEAWVTDATGTHKVFFYLGQPPNFTGCPTGIWTATGNLASPTSLVDDSQLPGGSWSDTYSNAQAKYGSDAVTAVYLDADGGWNGDQTVQFDNTQVNNQLFTYDG